MQLQVFRTEFENLCMKLGEAVADYIGRAMEIANKM